MVDANGNEILVGDRVVVVSQDGLDDNSATVGKTGTVVAIDIDWYDIGVEFDEPINCGHSCDGLAKDKRGFNGYADEVLVYNKATIEITVPFDDFMMEVRRHA